MLSVPACRADNLGVQVAAHVRIGAGREAIDPLPEGSVGLDALLAFLVQGLLEFDLTARADVDVEGPIARRVRVCELHE